MRKREQLDLRATRQLEIEFKRLPFLPIRLGDDRQPEHLCVEVFRSWIVRADDRDVVNAGDLHGSHSALFAAARAFSSVCTATANASIGSFCARLRARASGMNFFTFFRSDGLNSHCV